MESTYIKKIKYYSRDSRIDISKVGEYYYLIGKYYDYGKELHNEIVIKKLNSDFDVVDSVCVTCLIQYNLDEFYASQEGIILWYGDNMYRYDLNLEYVSTTSFNNTEKYSIDILNMDSSNLYDVDYYRRWSNLNDSVVMGVYDNEVILIQDTNILYSYRLSGLYQELISTPSDFIYGCYEFTESDEFGNEDYFLRVVSVKNEFISNNSVNVSVDENTSNVDRPIGVYPNPAEDQISITNAQDYSSLSVLNINGQVMRTEKLISENQQVDVSSLSPGIYFLKLEGGKHSETKKIVIR